MITESMPVALAFNDDGSVHLATSGERRQNGRVESLCRVALAGLVCLQLVMLLGGLVM